MKITKNQLKQIIKEELTAVLNESPPLFSQPSALERLPSPASPASQFISDFDPAERLRSLNAPEQGPKPINIKRVFDPEGNVLDPSKGAAITAHTIRLLAATGGGSSLAAAAAAERGDPIDVIVDMDGRAIAAKVAKSHSSQGKW